MIICHRQTTKTVKNLLNFVSGKELAHQDVNFRYFVHYCAVREVATEYFDSRKILPKLLDEAISCSHHIESHERGAT